MPVTRKVFYGFHFEFDCWRVSQVRNIGAIEANPPASDNAWEALRTQGDTAIKTWINGQLDGRTCTVVLIGSETANRPWVRYEIERSWNRGMGVLGVRIHGLKNVRGMQGTRGANPFSQFTMNDDGSSLADHVAVYDPPFAESTEVYQCISDNLSGWIEGAIQARAKR